MADLKQWIKSLIKVGRLVSSDDTNDKFRFGRIFYEGQPCKTNLFTPYGFYHNPPDGSLTVSWSQNGQDSNTLSQATGGTTRFKNLPKTGVKMGNPIKNSFIDFDDLGNIDISVPSGNAVTFTIGAATITIDENGITVDSGDVVADGISLKTHVHGGVQSGGSNTGIPV